MAKANRCRRQPRHDDGSNGRRWEGTAPSMRLQLRLITSHLAGAVAALLSLPYLLAAGLELQDVVLASFVGVAAFLALAIVGGLIWRRAIMARPIHAALAAPVALTMSIFLLLRVSSGLDADHARLAWEAATIGGFAALLSAAIFLLWNLRTDLSRSG